MSQDDKTEQAIQAAGADKALRVTPADLQANIVSEHYFTAAQGVFGTMDDESTAQSHPCPDALEYLTFCVLVLKNGFTVTGESACASPENFNAQIGRDIARQSAVSKVWPLMGYALKERLAKKPVDAIPAKPGKKTVVFLKTEHATGDVVSLKASDVVSVAEINDGVAVVKALAAELGEDGEVVNVVRSIGMTNTAAGSEVVILIGAGDIGLPAIPRGGDLYVQGIPPDAHKAVADAK